MDAYRGEEGRVAGFVAHCATPPANPWCGPEQEAAMSTDDQTDTDALLELPSFRAHE
jgi:hypothetical protein